MKKPALALVALISASNAHAACSLDGKPIGTGTTYNPSFTSRTLAITTVHPNDIIILHAALNAETGGSPSAITSVAGGGLSWARRFQQQNTVVACYSGPNDCRTDVEEWWAAAPVPLSSAVITVNASVPAVAYASLLIWGVHGSSGFDANGSLPTTAADLSGSSTNIVVPGVSTTSSPDMLFALADVFAPSVGSFFPSPAPLSTFNYVAQENLFISFGLSSATANEALAAPVSGITVTWDTVHSYPNWLGVIDALVCTTGGAFPNVQINE